MAKSSSNGANLGFEQKLWQAAVLAKQMEESKRMDEKIKRNLGTIGWKIE